MGYCAKVKPHSTQSDTENKTRKYTHTPRRIRNHDCRVWRSKAIGNGNYWNLRKCTKQQSNAE